MPKGNTWSDDLKWKRERGSIWSFIHWKDEYFPALDNALGREWRIITATKIQFPCSDGAQDPMGESEINQIITCINIKSALRSYHEGEVPGFLKACNRGIWTSGLASLRQWKLVWDEKYPCLFSAGHYQQLYHIFLINSDTWNFGSRHYPFKPSLI